MQLWSAAPSFLSNTPDPVKIIGILADYNL